ncbi:MAG: DUF4296 domain-containing protein [Chitinophagaceae bacterium]
MKKLLLLSSLLSVSVFFFIPACSNKDKLPKDILSKQQMENVLWDLVKSGEFLESYVLSKDTSSEKGSKAYEWYEHVFSIHKTTRAVFVKSYTWYQQHPPFMKEVLDSLSNKPTFVRNLTHADSLAIKDSILKDSILKDSTMKRDSIVKDSAFKPPLVLPGQKRPVFNIDSIRKARLRKRMK